MKIIVTGGRSFKDKDKVFSALNTIQEHFKTPITEIVHGGAPGVDSFSKQWAFKNAICYKGDTTVFTWVTECKALWKLYGKAAGPIRNMQMIDSNQDAKALVSFPGGRGTASATHIAKKAGMNIILVNEDGKPDFSEFSRLF